MNRLSALLLSTLLLIGALAAPAMADAETAGFFVARGETAMVEGRFDDAEKFIKRALDEESGFLPAILLRARVALKQGDKDKAIQALESVIAGRDSAITPAEKRALRDAKALMGTLDAGRADFEKLQNAYFAKILKLARSSAKRKPKMAAACYQQILAIEPGHAEATRGLEALGGAGGKTGRAKRGKALFNGKNLDGWDCSAPAWTVKDKVLNARMDGMAQIVRHREKTSGNFELSIELRVVKDMGPNPLFGMLFGGRGDYDHFGLYIWDDSLRLEHKTGEKTRRELRRKSPRQLPGSFDRMDWHVYRVVRKGKRLTVFVDGKEVFSFSGMDREPDGFVGMWAQEALFEIKSYRLAK